MAIAEVGGATNMRFANLLVVPLAWAVLTVSASTQEKAPRFGLVIANASYAEADSVTDHRDD